MRRSAAWMRLLLALAGAGCVPAPPPGLVIANGSDPQVLDPHRATGAPEARVLSALHAGLTRLDPRSLEPRPDLAESWERDPAGRVWTFVLRENLHWSDGRPLSGEDLVESWHRLRDPATAAPYRNWLEDLEELRLEGRELRVRFRHPRPRFAEMCAWHALAPLPPEMRRRGPADPLPPRLVGSGPFRLAERRIRDRIRVEPNPWYWDAGRVRLPAMDFLTVESGFTALNLFLTGDAHFLADFPALARPALEERERRRAREAAARGLPPPRPEYAPAPFLATAFLRLNCSRPPLDDPRLRLALALSLDREALARLAGGGRRPAFSLVPPWMPDYEPARCLPPDLETARALVQAVAEERGGLRPLELLTTGGELHRDTAEALQDHWRRSLGLEIRITVQEWKVLLAAQNALEYDLSRSSWIGDYLDPETFLEVFRSGSGNNRTGWADMVYDRLLDRARAAADAAERARLLQAAEQRLLDQAPVLTLWFETGTELVSSRVLGFERNLRGVVDWAGLALAPEAE